MKTSLTCPKCGPATRLVIRKNKRLKTEFLGCENWPECDYTRELPEHVRMEALGQPTLFSVEANKDGNRD